MPLARAAARGESPERVSPMRSQDVCGAPTHTSGVKNIASAIFFALSDMSKRSCAETPRGEIREDDFSDGITGCLRRSVANIRSEKYCIGKIFHSFEHAGI